MKPANCSRPAKMAGFTCPTWMQNWHTSPARRAGLFSGWNWQATRFSRPTIAANGLGVVGLGDDVVGPSRVGVIGVDEVDRRLALQPLKHGARTQDAQGVPAHVGDLHAEARVEADDAARQKPEAMVLAVFLAGVEKQLQPEADAQAGPPRRARPRKTPRPAPSAAARRRVGERPDARQDDLRGAAEPFRVACDFRLVADGLDRLLDAAQVAHAVVDDRDHEGHRNGGGRRFQVSGTEGVSARRAPPCPTGSHRDREGRSSRLVRAEESSRGSGGSRVVGSSSGLARAGARPRCGSGCGRRGVVGPVARLGQPGWSASPGVGGGAGAEVDEASCRHRPGSPCGRRRAWSASSSLDASTGPACRWPGGSRPGGRPARV